jgi:hypothetical protein
MLTHSHTHTHTHTIGTYIILCRYIWTMNTCTHIHMYL